MFVVVFFRLRLNMGRESQESGCPFLVTIDSKYSSLVHNIHLQLPNKKNTDVVILSGDQSVSVHSVFLKNCSPMLNSLFQSSCPCFQQTVILPSSFSSVLSSFTSLLYTGIASNIHKEKVEQLMLLAKELGIMNIDVFELKDNTTDIRKKLVDRTGIDDTTKIPVLKLETIIVDLQSNETLRMSFPKSRIKRNITELKDVGILDRFEGRIQKEYNESPVGQYMGPYDQNKKLKLAVQLPMSKLDFEDYTSFLHQELEPCRILDIGDSYNQIDDLKKIDVLKISDKDISDVQNMRCKFEKDGRIFYSCQNGGCFIPCPCLPCTDVSQCLDHRIKHIELFNVEEHSISEVQNLSVQTKVSFRTAIY